MEHHSQCKIVSSETRANQRHFEPQLYFPRTRCWRTVTSFTSTTHEADAVHILLLTIHSWQLQGDEKHLVRRYMQMAHRLFTKQMAMNTSVHDSGQYMVQRDIADCISPYMTMIEIAAAWCTWTMPECQRRWNNRLYLCGMRKI